MITIKGSSFTKKRGTLIALACAAVFAVPQIANAAGEESGTDGKIRTDGHPLTLQGNISVGYGRQKADGATAGGGGDYVWRGAVWTGESNIRFSASSKLDGTFFQGIGFQVETGFETDDGFSSSTAGVLATRNTGLGVKTSIGSIWGGKWDTPMKDQLAQYMATTSAVGLGASTTGFTGSQGFGGGTGGTSNGGAGLANSMNFRRRQVNTLNYYTPTFSGFQGLFQYSADEEVAQGPSPAAKPYLWSAAIAYYNGPLHASIAYERHEDYLWGGLLGAGRFGAGSLAAGAGTNSSDNALGIGVSYEFGNTWISAYWERLKWSQTGAAAALTDLDASKWYIGLKQKISGPHSIAAAYGQAGDYSCSGTAAFTTSARGCSDTGATLYNIAYRYRLDKVSSLNVFWGRLDNDTRAMYVPSGGLAATTGAGDGNTAGNTQTSYSIGINSSF